MLDDDPITRQLIAVALGRTLDEAVREHVAGITQEAPLTARLGAALERSLDGRQILGRRIEIITQDIPDRGAGALESRIGADLYVGIRVDDETKGFFVQAKLRRNLRGAGSLDALKGDCRDMLARTDSSYVWIYGSNGVRVIDAKQLLHSTEGRVQDLPTRRASTVFARTLECSEGSPDLGLPLPDGSPAERRKALGRMLEELGVRNGVGIIIE